MTAPAEPKATKRYTIINTRANVTQQIEEAKRNGSPIIFDVESEITGYPSILTLFYRMEEFSQTRPDKLYAMSERLEDVTVYLPKNPEEPATAILPN